MGQAEQEARAGLALERALWAPRPEQDQGPEGTAWAPGPEWTAWAPGTEWIAWAPGTKRTAWAPGIGADCMGSRNGVGSGADCVDFSSWNNSDTHGWFLQRGAIRISL